MEHISKGISQIKSKFKKICERQMNRDESNDQKCPTCGLAFYKIYSEDEICVGCQDRKYHAFDEKYREEKEKAELEIRMKSILTPLGYEKFKFKNFIENNENLKVLKACKEFNPEQDNFFIHGESGSGKTHLAYATARKFMEKKWNVGVFKQSQIYRAFRGKTSKEESELHKKFIDYRILIIDDLGVSKDTEFSNQILYEIVDNRYMNLKKGMIITSNLSLKDMVEKKEETRIVDRLFEMCKILTLKTKKSWRTVK